MQCLHAEGRLGQKSAIVQAHPIKTGLEVLVADAIVTQKDP